MSVIEDRESVIINIVKPRKVENICKDKVKEKLYRKSVKTNRRENKHSLPAMTVVEPLPAATINRDELLLPFVSYSKRQEKDMFRERLGLSIYDVYKIAYAQLRYRLHTENPVTNCRGITDCDPTFFTCVKSNMVTSFVAPYKSLKYLYDCQLRLRQEIGYRRDCLLNIDTNYKMELNIFDASLERYIEQVKYLDDFILADYNKSMLFLNKWDEIKNAVSEQTIELEYLAAKKFTLMSKILGLDYKYGLQQKYGRFLYYLSPPNWRLRNRNFARSVEIEAKGFDFGISSEEDTFNVIFENIKRECNAGLVKPVLYFENPVDLMDIFDGMEQQQLHFFHHVARLTPHASQLKKGIKLFKDIIAQDSAGINGVIEKFEKMLLFYEQQCAQLKTKFFKILNGLFYETVAAPELLKLKLHLEFCYAKIYNEKPMNLEVMGTAKALEAFYMDYVGRLESITAAEITTAVKQSIESEQRKYRRAKKAARELRLFERLERALLRAFSLEVDQNPSTFYSNLKKSVPKKIQRELIRNDSNRKTLTEEEIEYLSLFTDWTESEDPAKYLRSLSLEKTSALMADLISK